ncbi:MAG: CocE/NonD family hydrolase [Gemmatimonadota bacterium]
MNLGLAIFAAGILAPFPMRGQVVSPPASAADSAGGYAFRIERGWLAMKDGVRLSVTWFRPVPRKPGETFPALLELLPYRKDDSFYRRDYPLYTWFARHGFLMAKVDIRGTGGSDGALPEREYSESELDDAVEIIRQLARAPGSNGNVGMWGISWGGFNALQVAMRRPPELKAIIALHASDDLYHDDVRYIDGALHIDPYVLQIDHENGLPRTPDYPLDSAYFRDRFEAYPWVLTYLKHPVDGDFWRRNALRWRYDAIRIPCYMIGGLLDGYRDTPIRMLEHMHVPLQVEIGPWNHSWPDDGTPGPNYEWRARAVEWWNHWLRGAVSAQSSSPRLTLFVRDGHPPDAERQTTPGRWRTLDWPVPGATVLKLFPTAEHGLASSSGASVQHILSYQPGYGMVGGDWWGEPTGDMRPDDAGGLVYDGPVLTDSIELIGMPAAELQVTSDAPIANWVVRLEDVAPDGAVSLVTGAAINGAERESMLAPTPTPVGTTVHLALSLHFTTWIFRPGHRIRFAVSNAQFPMLWPSPRRMTTVLSVGDSRTSFSLPVVPMDAGEPAILPAPAPRDSRPDSRSIAGAPVAVNRVIRDQAAHTTSVEWSVGESFTLGSGTGTTTGPHRIDNFEREYYETHDARPGLSRFQGDEAHRIRAHGLDIELRTRIDIRSDETRIIAAVTRKLLRSGKVLREKTWTESIPREIH